MTGFNKYLPISLVVIFLMMNSFAAIAQQDSRAFYRRVKSDYKDSLRQLHAQNCRQFGFVDAEFYDTDENSELLQIMILRHQKVDLEKQAVYSFHEAYRYLHAYDTSDIIPVNCNPLQVDLTEIDSVYGSDLRRSVETAQLLFDERLPVGQYALFREFRNNPAALPMVTLPINYWRAMGTLRWLLGLEDAGPETFRQARHRTREAAAFLDAKAKEEKKVLLIGHGFFNILLKRYLKQNGWKIIHNGGFKNLWVSVLVKVVQERN